MAHCKKKLIRLSTLCKQNSRMPHVFLSEFRHILKAGLDPGPWTLDSGLWTLDSGLWTLDSGLWTLDSGLWFFSSQNFIPPKKNLYLPPKNLYISPMKLPPPPINISSPKYSVRVFKQTTLFPPPTSSKKPLCLPLKTAPSQKPPSPPPNKKYNYIGID